MKHAPTSAVPIPHWADSTERKPMARATRVPLFEREVRERLSGAALDLLFGRAEILAEGRRAHSASSGEAFFGTLMLTLDLSAGALRERADAETLQKIAAMLMKDGRVVTRVQKIADSEAARLAGSPVQLKQIELHIRVKGSTIYLDAELEGAQQA